MSTVFIYVVVSTHVTLFPYGPTSQNLGGNPPSPAKAIEGKGTCWWEHPAPHQDPKNQIIMAGTFGAVVKDKAGRHILSNNYVLADENRLPVGAPIFQPGLLDRGDANADQIAALTRFIALQAAANKVDCAIAKVTSNNLVSKDVLHIGASTRTDDAIIDMAVHKFGRTTSYTVGQMKSIDTDVTVGYETGNFTFHEQIIIVGSGGHPFSAAGDSGSLILQRGTNKAVGLLFAGSNTHTIANHIGDVLLFSRI